MSREHIAKLWVLVGIVLCAVILPPIFFGEPRVVDGEHGGDSWRNILYDFQTLFTGILALGAAALTIVQSRLVDERQQKRHNDLLELQMRPDKLRVERAYVAYDQVKKCNMFISGWQVPPVRNDGERFSADEYRNLGMIAHIARQMSVELAREEIHQIRDLFDGSLHSHYDQLKRDLDRFSDLLKVLSKSDGQAVDTEVRPGMRTGFAMDSDMRRAAIFAGQQQHANVLRSFNSFALSFERLVWLYKII